MDSYQKLSDEIKRLQQENSRLKELLDRHGIAWQKTVSADMKRNYTEDDANHFLSMFWGRLDVYARGYYSKNNHQLQYAPVCANGGTQVCPHTYHQKQKCSECAYRVYRKVTLPVIRNHLEGRDLIGIYPLFADGTCRLIVFDFDNHDGQDETWKEEVDTLRKICRQNHVPALVERSRSGNGAHVWIFFQQEISAALARRFGTALLEKGAEDINLKSFHYFDRMMPMQDKLKEGQIGNLIALPLQPEALQHGNSAFVDEIWQVYPDQWNVLMQTHKLSAIEIQKLMESWHTKDPVIQLVSEQEIHHSDDTRPWQNSSSFQQADLQGSMDITLADAIYINTDNLKPRIQNQIRAMAAFYNPKFFRNQAMGLSNYNEKRLIYLGSDSDHYIRIPRGLQDALAEFLKIDEDMPVYTTPSGRQRKRKSIIGTLQGAHDTLNGIVDIAMAGSLYHKGEYHPLLSSYGMVIVDECHHAASETITEVLQHVKARYVYGVTATPKRSDGLQNITFMMIGPIRYVYSAKQRAADQGIAHLVYPRFTSTVRASFSQAKMHPNEAYQLIRQDRQRNELIIRDTENCLKEGRTPVILTRYVDHAQELYDHLKDAADHVYLLEGKRSRKEQEQMIAGMKAVPLKESVLVIATGKLVGEGFDFPRLDTLIMAAPVAFNGVVEQYAGRLNRDAVNKKDVIVYDYVDMHIPMFDRMYHKRLRAYKQIGYELYSGPQDSLFEPSVNAIYDDDTYVAVWKNDMRHAHQEIILSCPKLSIRKVSAWLHDMADRQVQGIRIVLITWAPEMYHDGDPAKHIHLLNEIRQAGIEVNLIHAYGDHFCLIDRTIVWYGSVNMLGPEAYENNLMRVESSEIASELLCNVFVPKKQQKTLF